MKNDNKMLKKALLASIAALALGSCASSNKSAKGNNTMQPVGIGNMGDIDNGYLILSDSQRETIRNGNTFALNLFRTQMGMDSKVISPLSVAYLMGMLANGADGVTRTEILRALGMDGVPVATLNEAYKSIINVASRCDTQTTINVANCVAVNRQISLKSDFKKAMTDIYGADIESLDFGSSEALKHINGWCSKQTNGMIPKIVDQLDPNALAVLMNAIYFNGTWISPFDKSETRLEAFRGYTRGIKRVQMMHQNDKFDYASNSDFTAVSLPYGNGTYSMTVILPNEGKSVTDVMGSLDAGKLANLSNSMEKCFVDLKLPRFTTTTETTLNKPITELGAPSIFLPGKANFRNISDAPMFVSAMKQKAKIDVCETGTKAAAVTAGIMTMSALPDNEPRHVVFHANHPFVYIITEHNTGSIFFIGQYTGTEE